MWAVQKRHNLKIVIVSGAFVIFGLLFTQHLEAGDKLGILGVVIILLTLALRATRQNRKRQEKIDHLAETRQAVRDSQHRESPQGDDGTSCETT